MPKETGALGYYILKRILEGIPVLFVIIVMNFVLIHAAPGTPAYYLAGELASPEWIEQINTDFGLDQPIHIQLVRYLANVVKGNLGYSYLYRQPVLNLVLDRFQATLMLMVSVVILSAAMGIVLGVLAAVKVHSWADNILSTISLWGYATPAFWSGLLLLLVFGFTLNWFPMGGMVSLKVPVGGLAYWLDLLWHMVLPVANLSLLYLALIFRLTRASMLDNLDEDYIMTARSKGLSQRTVLFKHALRNAILPVAHVIGNNFGRMLGGAVLTETIFGWPGIGSLVKASIFSRDYPVLMGVFIIVGLSVVLANIVTDIVSAYLDPRVRYK